MAISHPIFCRNEKQVQFSTDQMRLHLKILYEEIYNIITQCGGLDFILDSLLTITGIYLFIYLFIYNQIRQNDLRIRHLESKEILTQIVVVSGPLVVGGLVRERGLEHQLISL